MKAISFYKHGHDLGYGCGCGREAIVIILGIMVITMETPQTREKKGKVREKESFK